MGQSRRQVDSQLPHNTRKTQRRSILPRRLYVSHTTHRSEQHISLFQWFSTHDLEVRTERSGAARPVGHRSLPLSVSRDACQRGQETSTCSVRRLFRTALLRRRLFSSLNSATHSFVRMQMDVVNENAVDERRHCDAVVQPPFEENGQRRVWNHPHRMNNGATLFSLPEHPSSTDRFPAPFHSTSCAALPQTNIRFGRYASAFGRKPQRRHTEQHPSRHAGPHGCSPVAFFWQRC